VSETHQPRVVSLIASATEIVCALGGEQQLVGRSHECDYPDSVHILPAITRSRVDTGNPSGRIDAEIKSILSRALSVYEVDGLALQRLAPDVIVTQTQCEVCAVSLADVELALADWTGVRPRVVSLAPDGLADVWQDIERVAAALDRRAEGQRLVSGLKARTAAIAAKAAGCAERPRVACIEWIEPLMAAGNWMPELVELAGGRNLFGVAGRHSPWMRWDELVAADPDVILVLPCGFDIGRTRAEMPALAAKPEWPRLAAVRGNRVFLCDGSQYFNRPGPRLADSLEILAEILHPQAFGFGHRGRGWAPF